MRFGWESRFSEGIVHKTHPAIASGLIDMEGKVASAKTGMPALGDVILRAAETIDQEIAKTLFGSGTFMGGIHGTKNVVIADLAIESGNEAREAIFTDDGIEILFVHTSVSEIAIQCSTGANGDRGGELTPESGVA